MTLRTAARLAALATYLVLLAPLLVVVAASFDGGGQAHFRFPPRDLSFRWYADLQPRLWQALGLSLRVAGVVAAGSAILGAAAALGLARGSLRDNPALATWFRLPLQIPFVVTGLVFLQAFNLAEDASGLRLLGTLPGYAIAHLALCTPYTVGAVGTVLTTSLRTAEDAARIAGATEWRVFRRVTLPAIMPGLFAGAFFSAIVSFGDVPISAFLGAGGLSPLPVEVFQILQFDFDPRVLAISTVAMAISAALVLAMQRLIGLDLVLPGRERR